MTKRLALWLLASAATLTFGFAALLIALWLLADIFDALGTDRRAEAQIALVVYYRVILLKALLPQLTTTILLWPFLRTRTPTWLSLTLGATTGYAVATPLLLTQDVATLPALQMPHLGQHAATYALTTTAVTATAAALGRQLHLFTEPEARPQSSRSAAASRCTDRRTTQAT